MSADWIVFNSKTGFKMKYFTFNSQMSGCHRFLFVLYLIKNISSPIKTTHYVRKSESTG